MARLTGGMMFRLGPFRLASFTTPRRQRFEAAVAEEVDYLLGAFGDSALSRGIERASRSYISSRRREVIKEAVRRIALKTREPDAEETRN